MGINKTINLKEDLNPLKKPTALSANESLS